MTIKEYQSLAKRTCPSLDNNKLDLCHMVLGIFSEYEEYMLAVMSEDRINQSEECSDMMWYMANYCTFRNLDLEELYNNRQENKKLNFTIVVSILQDMVKKYIAYNKEINVDKEGTILKYILYYIKEMYGEIDIHTSLNNNINKLKIRFPEGFKETHAINRNTDKELIELSKNF